MPYDWDAAELRARNMPRLDTRGLDDGAITQGSWLDFQPVLKNLIEGAKEMVGLSSSERLMKHLADIKSPVMRPQSGFEWADKGAGIAAETLQTGLAATDLAALAPVVGRRMATSLGNEIGTFGGQYAKNPPKDPAAWFTGMEGKRKFEIDDRALRFKRNIDGSNILSDIVQHDELFKQYPEINDVPTFVTIDPKIGRATGYYHGADPQKGYAGELVVKAPSEESAKDTLTHEIQHWIQQKEGFARGGSPALGLNKDARKFYDEMAKDIIAKRDAAKASGDWKTYDEMQRQLVMDLPQQASFKAYQNLAGEIEARDAANRRTWPMDLRRTMPPDLRKDAIIRMEDGTAASVKDTTKMEPLDVGLGELDWLKSGKVTPPGKQGGEAMKDAADYRGLHTAPTRMGRNSLDDLTDIYHEDIYGPNGPIYYGHGGDEVWRDSQSVGIIRAFKGRPNRDVTIYRAVPSDITNESKIAIFENEKKYILKHGKVPPGVETKLNSSAYYDKISNEIDRLKTLPPSQENPYKINAGDWVTINRSYAVDHGKREFGKNYKILSKKVKARELFTDGNSIHEWGYDPSPADE